MNEVQLEAALTVSDPDSEARKKVEEEIRKIVRAEVMQAFANALWAHDQSVRHMAEQTFVASNQNFRDGVLSVVRDMMNNPRYFSNRM